MNRKLILNIIGKIVAVEAASMLPALAICLFRGDGRGAMGFALTILIMAAIGIPSLLLQPKKRSFFAREGFVTVGLAWIAVSALGALPFLIGGYIPSYIDCLFETVSGFTTTGASILSNVEGLSRGMLYWRSFTHWLGGMGVLVFVLALSPLTSKDSGENMHLLRAESPGIRISKLVPRMRSSAMILYAIYIALTLLQVVLLLCGGLPFFDSLTTAFGTAGTGGFGIYNDSIASFSPYCQWVITVFMLLFGVNFNVYYLLLLRQFHRAVKLEELRLYGFVVFLAIVVITANVLHYFTSFGDALRHAAFQVASIISTTGFSTTDFDLWPQLSRMILLLLMFMGSCAGSTGGGAKSVRVLVMLKAMRRSIYKVLHPNSVRLIHMDGEVLDEETVSSVNSYMITYFLLLAGMTLLVTVDGKNFETSFSAVVACMNNIGPGLGAVGPAMNYGSFSIFSKLVLTLAMLIGRLEIYPILVLFTPRMWRR